MPIVSVSDGVEMYADEVYMNSSNLTYKFVSASVSSYGIFVLVLITGLSRPRSTHFTDMVAWLWFLEPQRDRHALDYQHAPDVWGIHSYIARLSLSVLYAVDIYTPELYHLRNRPMIQLQWLPRNRSQVCLKNNYSWILFHYLNVNVSDPPQKITTLNQGNVINSSCSEGKVV